MPNCTNKITRMERRKKRTFERRVTSFERMYFDELCPVGGCYQNGLKVNPAKKAAVFIYGLVFNSTNTGISMLL